MGERGDLIGNINASEFDSQRINFDNIDHLIQGFPLDRRDVLQSFRTSTEFLSTVSALTGAYDYLKAEQKNRGKTKGEFEETFRKAGGAFVFEKLVEHHLNTRPKRKYKKIPKDAFCIPNTLTDTVWNALYPDRQQHTHNSLFLGIRGITVPDMILAEIIQDDEKEEFKIDGIVECSISERKFEDKTQAHGYNSHVGENLNVLTSPSSETTDYLRGQIIKRLPYSLTSQVTFRIPLNMPIFYAYTSDVTNVPESVSQDYRLPMTAVSSTNICDFADAIRRDLEFQRLVDGERQVA